MSLFVVLLRGINVSGHHIIRMNDLKTSISLLGYQNIQTYLQSGNVIFTSEEKNLKKIEDELQRLIKKDFGYNVPVVVFTKEYFLKIFRNNPLLKASNFDLKKLAVVFLDQIPEKELINSFNIDNYPEKIIIVDRVIYLYYPNGIGRSKLNNKLIERKLKVIATARNWNTVSNLNQKLLD